jgi:tuftelin-interacting protein 11
MNLYATWANILPDFIRDNILDQLILPKVKAAMSDWSPRTSDYTLHGVVFPWLQYAGTRMEEILQDAKRRLKSWLKGWKPRDGVPPGFDIWQSVHEPGEWDTLMLKTVLPVLGTLLREKFTVNPRQQIMEPLEQALAWRPYLKSTMLDQLLEIEFFAKWLDALYVWLTAPNTNYDQVGQWCVV